MPRKKHITTAVIDFETDPFKYGRVPKPFVCGFYAEGVYKEFWGDGDECVRDLVQWLDDQPANYRIYAHNGGKFDFFLMLDHIENPLKIINGRIVKAKLGRHELRDSYAMIPIPLAAYQKDEIDYALFEREVRDRHRAAIGSYLRADCVYLHRLVMAFLERFGDKITIGATAIGKLREFHPFNAQFESHDKTFRPFYFGGRVEALETGIIKDKWKVFDVNSMYPHVMAEFDHPTGREYRVSYSAVMDKKGRMSGLAEAPMYFAIIECKQWGAFPTRVKNEPLSFDLEHGEFFVTSHELRAALAAGRVAQVKVKKVFAPAQVVRFKEYVSHYVAEKIAAKQSGDKVGEIFAKLLLNSAYGKFGTNPEHYKDYWIQQDGEPMPDEPYSLSSVHGDGINLWEKDANAKRFYDVATAASITGAARSVLLTALAKADRPVYCDTDSIICRDLDLPQHNSRLGAWKLEAEGDTVAIAGKKLYALRAGKEYVKVASKGVRLEGRQIFDLVNGKDQHWQNEAPSFSLTRGVSFVNRTIKSKR